MKRRPGSAVDVATGHGLDGPGIESRWERDFPHLSRSALGPASCRIGTGSFPGVKNGRGVTLTPHPLLVPQARKGRAIPLLPLWAVRPVQSFSACTRVTFTTSLYSYKYSTVCVYIQLAKNVIPTGKTATWIWSPHSMFKSNPIFKVFT